MSYERVAVTGGSGRLGRYVVDRLKGKHALTVVDRREPHAADVAFRNVSVTDLADLRATFEGHDAVLHLAAVPNPRTASPAECFHVNTQGTWAVLQAAEDAGVRRVVVASSDSATGLHYNPVDWPPQYLPVDEAHPLRPTEVYSLSKKVTEAIAKSFADRGRMEVLVIRPGHIVFEPEYPELEARGSDVNNYHLWGYVAPEDVAQGFERAMDLPDGRYDVFFVGAADGLNTRPTLEMLKERFGHVPEVRDPALYERNPCAGVFGIAHARARLGYEPTLTWRDFRRG